MRLLLLRAVLLTGIGLYFEAHLFAEQEIESGQSLKSPDGRFTAELTNDGEGDLHITSNTTGKLYKVGVFRPLYSIKWTRDSQTIVTIEHLAGGSEATLIHFDGRGWNRFEVDPTEAPPPDHHYAVVGQEIGRNRVKLTYKVTDEESNGIITKFYLCSFDVDPRSRSIANMRKHEISADAYWTMGLQHRK